MKFYTLLFGVFFTTINLLAQPFNQELEGPGGTHFLIGKINQSALEGPNYKKWFSENYDSYEPKEVAIESLKETLQDFTITAFMGTWCGDSKREVPRFYKVLKEAHFPMERMTLVALDRERSRYKQSPGGEHEGMNIHRVPTFIIYKNGVEVNRIVEDPVVSLEEDLVSILQGNYTPQYQAVTLVNDKLNLWGIEKFNKKQKKIKSEIAPYLKSMYELNTYAAVLFYAGKTDESLSVARLNINCYPDEAKTYLSLGRKLEQLDRSEEAKLTYEKGIQVVTQSEELIKARDALGLK